MTEYSKETVETYWDMMGVTEWKHKGNDRNNNCDKCDKDLSQLSSLDETVLCSIPDTIKMSTWELAGFMRDKARSRTMEWAKALMSVQSDKTHDGVHWSWWFELATPEQ